MSVKQRLIEYLESKKISQRGFSISIGMHPNYVTNIKNSIQPDVVHKISVHCPDLNTGWLLTGEGEMLKNNVTITGDIHVNNKSGAITGNMITGNNNTIDCATEVEYLKEQCKLKDKIIELLEMQLKKQ